MVKLIILIIFLKEMDYRDAYLELILNPHRRAFHWIVRFIPHLLLPYQRRATYPDDFRLW